MTDLLVRDLDPELRNAMEAMAKAERRSLSDVAKQLLARGVAGYAASGGMPSRGLGTRLQQLGKETGGFGELLPNRHDTGRMPPFLS